MPRNVKRVWTFFRDTGVELFVTALSNYFPIMLPDHTTIVWRKPHQYPSVTISSGMRCKHTCGQYLETYLTPKEASRMTCFIINFTKHESSTLLLLYLFLYVSILMESGFILLYIFLCNLFKITFYVLPTAADVLKFLFH